MRLFVYLYPGTFLPGRPGFAQKTAPENLRGSGIICRVGRSTQKKAYSAIFLNSS